MVSPMMELIAVAYRDEETAPTLWDERRRRRRDALGDLEIGMGLRGEASR
jgi:hypothetical protein